MRSTQSSKHKVPYFFDFDSKVCSLPKIEQEEMHTLKSDAPRLDRINRESEQSSAVFYSVKKNDARPQN